MVSDTSGMWNRTLSSGGVFIYKCVATNSLGSTESEIVTVTVNGKQLFVLTTDYCVVFIGMIVNTAEIYLLSAMQSNVQYFTYTCIM